MSQSGHAVLATAQRFARAVGVLIALAVCTAPVSLAQAPADAVPPVPTPHPERVPYEPPVPPAGTSAGAGGPSAVSPDLPITIPTVDALGNPLPPQPFTLVPVLMEGGDPVPDGVNWRIYAEENNAPGPLVADIAGGTARLDLNPGRYYLHAMYGWAAATTQIIVTPDRDQQTVVLNAGGLRLRAAIGVDEEPIPAAFLRFEVWGLDPTIGERILITDAIGPDQIIRLNAGRYLVVSQYGDINAEVRAEIDVQAGQLTEVALFHEAARVTLKLVTTPGGEALANTAWSVLTPAGDVLFETVGAFPTLILAAGDYLAVARNNNQVYERSFTVETRRDRDVEVLTANVVAPGL